MTEAFQNLQRQVRNLREHGFTTISLKSRRNKLQQVVNQWLPVFNSLSNDEKQFLKNANFRTLTNTVKRYNQLGITDAPVKATQAQLRKTIARNIKQFTAIQAKLDQTNNLNKAQIKRQLKRFPNLRPDLRKGTEFLRGALARILANNNENVLPEPQAQQQNQQATQYVTKNPVQLDRFQDSFQRWRFRIEPETKDKDIFLNLVNPQIKEKIEETLKNYESFKTSLRLVGTFEGAQDPTITTELAIWSSKDQNAVSIFSGTNIDEKLEELEERIENATDEMQVFGSGWVIRSIHFIELNMSRFKQFSGRAGNKVELPECLKNNRGIINPQGGEDGECGLWAILIALNHHLFNQHKYRVSKYKKFKEQLVLQKGNQKVNFPLRCPSDINTLEKLNPWLSVSVFSPVLQKQNAERKREAWQEKLHSDHLRLANLSPVRVAPQKKESHVNLLLYENEDNDIYHYCVIKELGLVLASGNTRPKYVCENCLQSYTRYDKYQFHLQNGCLQNEGARPDLPKFGEHYLKFTNYHKQLRLPFAIYCDLESDLIDYDQTNDEKFKNSSKTLEQEHKPNSIAGRVVSMFPEYNETVVFYNTDEASCIEQYIDWLVQRESDFCDKMDSTFEEMTLTDDEEKHFQNATHCYICHGELGNDRHRDHCHLTGQYRGASHKGCNLNKKFKQRFSIPVIFHNLRGYDSHLIIRQLAEKETYDKKFQCLPQNLEKMITFGLGKLSFIDSMSFLGTSLEALVNNLKGKQSKTNKNLFKNLESEFQGYEQEHLDLLKQKGIYPYKFANGDPLRFNVSELPSIDYFYDDLKDEPCSEEDYNHAKYVWDKFNCQTFKDYHELYLKSDILLLADVFEEFRTMALNAYQLDPAQYLTAPALSWDAFLLTKTEDIELFYQGQYDMLLFIERAKRGGVSMISHRKSTSNNKYLTDGSYDPNQPNNYLMYLDMNNLYGWAMIQKLPVRNFEWDDPNEYDEEFLLNCDTEGEKGYFLEVDLEYPTHLHDEHNDLPFCPETTTGQWSNYCQEIGETLGIKLGKEEKLIPNLYDKKKYVIHFKYLQQALRNGLRLKKVHAVLKFTQSAVMKDYIMKNTNLRAQAQDNFEKDLYKLLNNSVFGKTLENVRNYSNLKVCTSEEQFQKQTRKATFKDATTISDKMIITDCQKETIQFRKPVFLGSAILDLSKYAMYKFWYEDFVKPKYANNARLCFMDTDSFCFEVKTNDVYKDMEKQKHLFDTSNFENPDTSFLKSNDNKKVLGKMKCECEGFPIKEFVGLRPKLYSLLMPDGSNEKKAKGVKKAVIKKQLSHQKFLNSLYAKTADELKSKVSFKTISSFKHRVFTENAEKSALSPLDSKRWILDDGITTLSHGHYKTRLE